jgi:hypothetical protein
LPHEQEKAEAKPVIATTATSLNAFIGLPIFISLILVATYIGGNTCACYISTAVPLSKDTSISRRN